MRGGILALSNHDIVGTYLQICKHAVAERFNTTVDRVGLKVDVNEGRLRPRFSISEGTIQAAGLDVEQAKSELGGTWALTRKMILGAFVRASERWCAL